MRIINNAKETNNNKILREIVRRAFYKNEKEGTDWIVGEVEILECNLKPYLDGEHIAEVKLNVYERYRFNKGLPQGEEEAGYKEYHLEIVAYRNVEQTEEIEWYDAAFFGYTLFKVSSDKTNKKYLVSGPYTRPQK